MLEIIRLEECNKWSKALKNSVYIFQFLSELLRTNIKIIFYFKYKINNKSMNLVQFFAPRAGIASASA